MPPPSSAPCSASSVKNDDECDVPYSDDSFQSLSDKVCNLIITQNKMSEQIMFLLSENDKLKNGLKHQSEIIGDIVFDKSTNNTYASKLKSQNLKRGEGSIQNLTSLNCNLIDKDILKPNPSMLDSNENVNNNNNNNNNVEQTASDKSVVSGHRVKESTMTSSLLRNPEGRPTTSKSESAAAESNRSEMAAESDSFQTVSYRKRNMRRDFQQHQQKSQNNGGRGVGNVSYRQNQNNNKPKFITGSSSAADGDRLKTAEKKSFLFVSRLSPDTDSKDLESFLLEKFSNESFKVESLNSKYPEEYCSFKVTIPSRIDEVVYKPDFWPKGVFVNRFVVKKSLNLQDKRVVPPM
ncbi:uncharacterized protein DDB_G0286591-like [Macrosteles quadrilineatus]|uniref:uncharacterized protein DDB_G0286591-like n=1 Tax=Macrosteles quadrilineatus TaxID=74068 RepID=UPI0023E1075E|nr:uncharacterized protein DDB_G0286591-like [Macrosteles quadrilineatus]